MEFKTLPHGAMVRHLVSGDLFYNDEPDSKHIEAIRRAHKRHPHVRGWGYTHGWRRLDADTLNLPNLTFNASCETIADVEQALEQGWPATLVVPEDHPKVVKHDKFTVVVCPNQTIGITCDRCRLCLKKDRKLRGKPMVVGFRAHGSRKKRVAEVLDVHRNAHTKGNP